MPIILTHSSKPKITVTLSADLLHQLDTLRHSWKGWSRSRLVEEALRQWLHEQILKELERQTEEYYHSLSKTEQKEDQQWARISAYSARRLWDK